MLNQGLFYRARTLTPTRAHKRHPQRHAGEASGPPFVFTDNKFSSERNCLNVVAYQDYDGFIVDGVKASLLNPGIWTATGILHQKIPVIFNN